MTTDPTREVPAAGAVVTGPGWVAPGDAGPPLSPTRRRAHLIVAWLIGLLVVGAAAAVQRAAADGSEAYRLGYAIGTFATPFLIVAGLRWLVVRVRRNDPKGPKGVLTSAWIPLGAAALAVFVAAGRLGDVIPPRPVDPATAMRVAPNFTLREADPATAADIIKVFRDDQTVLGIAVREVIGRDRSVSYLVAADARLARNDVEELARGMREDSDIEPVIERLMGQDVVLAVGPGSAMGAWVEPPLILLVYAADETLLREVMMSVLIAGP